MSPMLWDTKERESYLKGSPLLEEVNTRLSALKEEWNSISNLIINDNHLKSNIYIT